MQESVLRTEMGDLESQEEDAPKRIHWYKPMSWLGQISPHRRDESWSVSLWQTFFTTSVTSVGAQIPLLVVAGSFRLIHWGPPLLLYHPLGFQVDSPLGGLSNC